MARHTAVAVLLVLALSKTGWAQEPHMTVHLVEGGSSLYPVTSIERVTFESDTMRVVTTGGTETYLAETIARIDFLLDTSGVHHPDPVQTAALVKAVHLFQNLPNPFNPQTQITYELERGGRAEIRIFDVSGRLVRTLVEKSLPAGTHSVCWDGMDDRGRRVAGGVYFYQLTAPEITESRRMILLP